MRKSHGTIAARGLAPTAIQAATSSLILLSTEQKLDSLLLKIIALRSFQMIHMMSSTRLRIPFFGIPGKVPNLQFSNSMVLGAAPGSRAHCSPKLSL